MTEPRGRGRPSKIDQVVRTRENGTPVTTSEQVIERIRLGADMAVAAESAGISRNTLHQWRLGGARAIAHSVGGGELTAGDQALADFADALTKAEAEAELNRLAIINRAATGGAVVTKTTRKMQTVWADGKATEREVERTETTETLRPEWTAAAWWLERKRGYVRRLEVTGAEGVPLVPPADAARAIADSLRDFQAGALAAEQVAAKAKAPAKD